MGAAVGRAIPVPGCTGIRGNPSFALVAIGAARHLSLMLAVEEMADADATWESELDGHINALVANVGEEDLLARKRALVAACGRRVSARPAEAFPAFDDGYDSIKGIGKGKGERNEHY